jgi:predicted CopG family antitoxin
MMTKLNKDVLPYTAGFYSGLTTGLLVTVGVGVFVGYKGLKGLSSFGDVLRELTSEKEAKLAVVTDLNTKRVEELKKEEGTDATETTSGDSPPGAP